jgi:hypothetical protein
MKISVKHGITVVIKRIVLIMIVLQAAHHVTSKHLCCVL